MPIFEYKCNNCGKKFEIFHKSFNKLEEIKCPDCQSKNYKKLFSSFSASVNNSSISDNSSICSANSCDFSNLGSCSSGMCGLN